MGTTTLILFLLGFALLIAGADILVRGASALAEALGISPLIVGLTVVAFGTSAPELAVSINGALTGNPGIALGNVVGSNIANILLILGIAALVGPLIVDRILVRRELPLLVGVSIATMVFGLDGNIGLVDGIALTAVAVGYTAFAVHSSRKGRLPPAVAVEGDPPPPSMAMNVGMLVLGLAMLVLGADWLVDGAVAIAASLGLSDLVIALTIVAFGTSLPEIATSVAAGLRGERELAVGNAIGSNLFNLTLVLGLTSIVSPTGVGVPAAAMSFDMPIMTAVAIACVPVLATGKTVTRVEGTFFLVYYVAYTTWLFLRATEHDAQAFFGSAMLRFVIPLTLAVLGFSIYRHWRAHRAQAAGTEA